MLTCQCNNLDNSEHLLVMDYVEGKGSPIIKKTGQEYITNSFPTTNTTIIYLLCEEMHYQCHNAKAQLKRVGDCAFVSRFVCCPVHHEIKLSEPVSWEYHKVNGVPCDKYKIIPLPDHPLFFPETKSEWLDKLMKGQL